MRFSRKELGATLVLDRSFRGEHHRLPGPDVNSRRATAVSRPCARVLRSGSSDTRVNRHGGITSVAVSPVTLFPEQRRLRRGKVMIGADGDPIPTWDSVNRERELPPFAKGPKSASIYTALMGEAQHDVLAETTSPSRRSAGRSCEHQPARAPQQGGQTVKRRADVVGIFPTRARSPASSAQSSLGKTTSLEGKEGRSCRRIGAPEIARQATTLASAL